MNLDELEVNSPEWEAEVNRLQDEEDAARATQAAESKPAAEADTPKVDTSTPAGEATKAAPAAEAKPEAAAPAPAAAPAAADKQPEKPSDTAKPAGVASKDGKHVLPYAALQGARNETKAERTARLVAEDKVADLTRQLEDLKAGKKAVDQTADNLSQEDLDEIAADFPALVKVAQAARTAQAELAELKGKTAMPTAPAAPAAQEPEDDPVQDAIDSVPLLAEWQASDKEKFSRAVAFDKALMDSPKWKGRPLAERFAHAARQAAAEFDIEIEKTPQSTPNGQSKAPTEDRITAAERTAPNTLSDFKGGSAADTGGIDKLSPALQLDRLNNMSKAEFDAYLAKL